MLTHCNTGPLGAGQFGTALGVVQAAHHAERPIHVWVDETRPYLQGARLTAWELDQAGVPHTLIPDAAAGSLMARGDVDVILVGADRIAANGDTANKVGTYPLAVLAERHGIPFYVVAPLSSVDLATADGAAIPIEERLADEVTTIRGVRIAPSATMVWNPAFDVTPAALDHGDRHRRRGSFERRSGRRSRTRPRGEPRAARRRRATAARVGETPDGDARPDRRDARIAVSTTTDRALLAASSSGTASVRPTRSATSTIASSAGPGGGSRERTGP